jgi:hypothetical protein
MGGVIKAPDYKVLNKKTFKKLIPIDISTLKGNVAE